MPFEARPLPELIDLNGEIVAGPFCKHCGYPFTLHGPQMRCRVDPNAILPPSCECHEIKTVTVKVGRQMLQRPRIVRRVST